jgi:hypothetical protein
MEKLKLSWNPHKVLFGLSHIGYTPVEAILDIVDNSVSAGAKKISISIKMSMREAVSGSRGQPHAIVEAIEILDDGCGMDNNGIINALTLGADDSKYEKNSLSKFGLGLKSAAGSLGSELRLLSRRKGDSETIQAVLDHENIKNSSDYCCLIGKADSETASLINDHGTQVRISKLHKNLPDPSKITSDLMATLGLTYYFFLVENGGLKIVLNGEIIHPIDPLFCEAIKKNGHLNESDWDGVSPLWLLREKIIQIDDRCSAKFTVTQLPHPPSVGLSRVMTQAECRGKYLIDAQSYGVYVYRNKRLIARGDSLKGIIPRNQSLYSYRARLEITSDADDALNIDVAKSQIQLSDLAEDQLKPEIYETVRKSIAAWEHRTNVIAKLSSESPTGPLNEVLNKLALDEVATAKDDLAAIPLAERVAREIRNKEVDSKTPLDTKSKEVVLSENQRVLWEPTLPDNQLWCRRLDPVAGIVVVVNEGHRLVKEVLRSSSCPAESRALFEMLMFAMAQAEVSMLKTSPTAEMLSTKQIDAVFDDYRITVGEKLSLIMRRVPINVLLPD